MMITALRQGRDRGYTFEKLKVLFGVTRQTLTRWKAIAYMLKHWEPLTLFLRVPGAPLDNNICEQVLKKAILNRKNSLFYRTEHGAFIGDMFMSLIHTCNLGHVNPFDYLTALQKHASEVSKNPSNWMPWNYQDSIPVNDSC